MNQLVVQFKQFYGDLVSLPTNEFHRLYSDDVIFCDSITQIRGGAELLNYMDSLCAGLSYGRFEYLDQIVENNTAYLKWNLNFRHAKFGDRTMSVRGVTHLQFGEKIHYHENIFDPGVLVYESLPLAGAVTRWLKNRLHSKLVKGA